MSKTFKINKIAVGDIVYWNGHGEEENLVINVSGACVTVVDRGGMVETVSDGCVHYSRKPLKDVHYYRLHKDDLLNIVQLRVATAVREQYELLFQVEAAVGSLDDGSDSMQ